MRAIGPRRALLGAFLVAACGPTVIKATCGTPSAQEFNEPELCLGPPVMPDGLSTCVAGTPAGAPLAVCLVGPDARLYRAFIERTTRLEGAGWTWSSYGEEPSTLAAADVPRCAKLLPADAGSVPACP